LLLLLNAIYILNKMEMDISKFGTKMLSDVTTIRLGGTAKHFIECNSEEEIIRTLKFSSENNISVFVLGGGSNVIFDDEGFDGIILKVNLKGIEFAGDIVTVKAGEDWDEFVRTTIDNDFAGLECLSGIPGTAGATPVQNVGAYGVEVGNLITGISAIDRKTSDKVVFKPDECGFSYRNSRFKGEDKDKFIITDVSFRLVKSGEPVIKYPELAKYIGTHIDLKSLNNGKERVLAVRDAVLKIRIGKSMIVDENDADSHSCGSFFTNPVLKPADFNEFLSKCVHKNLKPPYFKDGENFKVSAAWLIENSGFVKGFSLNGAGISNKHSLALVNRGCKTKDILHLAEHIRKTVSDNFGVTLEIEPILAAYR